MLQYDRIDVSERIDINKTNKSKGGMLCHYWYFKGIGYKLSLVINHIVVMVVMLCQ